MLPRSSAVRVLLLALCLVIPLSPWAQAKRPLTHADADSWRSIASPLLSRDGQFVAYSLIPQEGDGEIVVRHLATAREWKLPTGGSSGLTSPSTFSSRPAQLRGSGLAGARMSFTADNRLLLLSVSPTRKEIEQARADKKPTPQTALVVLELASFRPTRIEDVRSWTLPEENGSFVAYTRAVRAEPARPTVPMNPLPPATRPGSRPTTPQRPSGTDLILRNLHDGNERTISDVLEHSFTKDGKLLVYTVSSKKEEDNGVYLVRPGTTLPPQALLAGKGRYQKLTWDEKQEQLVFLADLAETSPNAPARFRIHHWDRKSSAMSFNLPPLSPLGGLAIVTALQVPAVGRATELISATTPGLRKDWVVSERGPLGFSRDGGLLYLSTAPAAEANSSSVPADQRVDLDLWHWKDDFIQPMQKLRAESERGRTYRAVYHLKTRKLVQLADEAMPDVTSASDAAVVLGSDDRPYRRLVGSATFGGFSDVYVIDPAEGKRSLLLRKSEGGLILSPGGKYILSFDGKHWHSLSLATGKSVNLTGKLGVPFHNEESDVPGKPASYGVAGWTAGDASVLIQDRFDIWQLAPDGSEARNLTQGMGRKKSLQLRYQSLDPRERVVSLDQPLLLSASNLETYDTGFFRLDPKSGSLRCLIMAARAFSAPIKARDADVYLLTAQTFNEYPDLILTDPNFKELKKITSANPQKKDLNWGKAELISFKNSDGVALRAMLIRPENFEPGKKYPMVVYIYERLSQNLHRFVSPRPGTSINPSYYASNGYLVLMPDIAYTTGTPGQSAMKCVLPAIQAVADRGILDEKAIGIQGHSWGGYQISYMITQTTRFRAAVAGAPVANMVSAYNGIRWGSGLPRQFQYEQSQSRIGGTLWQYPQRFLENSPIFMADRVQTPLMMLHNDQDDAVPWYQGIEYYLALRRLEKEVYLLNYNGERHGLVKRAHQKDYSVRMQEFFDHHLKGTPKPSWMDKGVSYLDRVKKYGAPAPSPFQPATPPSGENAEEEP